MDGRIADAQGSLEFLTTIGSRAGGEDEFSSFLATIDAVLVGAGTLRWLLHHGHGWPHDDLPTWLVSHDDTLVSQIGATRAPFRRVEGPLAQAFDEMATAGHDRVWLCGGGDIAGQTLAIDRLDEVLITVAPTALGAGPALFDSAGLPRRRFRLVECRALGGHAARLGWSRDRDC